MQMITFQNIYKEFKDQNQNKLFKNTFFSDD